MKIKKMLGKISVFIATISLFTGGFQNVHATENNVKAEYTIKIANSNAPFTKINGQEVIDSVNAGCYAFKNYVEQNSGGRINVEIYDSGTLGGSSEGLSQCMQNVVQACVTGDGELSTLYPRLQVLCVPYLFDNRTQFYGMLDSEWMGSLFEDMRGQLGIRLLASSDNGGFRSISNNKKEIRTANDLKGLKIRCMEIPAYTTMLESMGATATPIAWAELYTSLQTGVVDGQENPPSNILNGSLQEVQKYYTLDQHSISSLVLMINDDFFNSLPEDLKMVVSEGGLIAQSSMRGANNANEELAMQGLQESNMKIYIPNEEEKLTFKEASQEPVLLWLKGQIGDEYVDSFMKEIDNIKNQEVSEFGGSISHNADLSVSSSQNSIVVGMLIITIFSALFGIFTLVRTKKND